MTDEGPTPDELRLPERSVLVHIGPHKTGTTSLQAALFTGRPDMAAQGVHHAGWSRNPARAIQSVTGQLSAYSDRSPSIRLWQALAKDVRKASEDRVILSSEFLAHAKPDVVRRVVDDLGRDRVHVVVTLRPLARILPSMWQQNIKAGRTAPFDEWLHRLFQPGPGRGPAGFWSLHDHDALIRMWAAEVGPDRVTAVVLDERDREMVLRTFERLLGLRTGTLGLVSGLANRSITAEEAETIRAYNIAHREAGLGKALHAVAMRFGAAQYLCRLVPTDGGTTIRLPAWVLEAVGERAGRIVDGIGTSGVRVVGDLDSLRYVPDPPRPEEALLPTLVPAEVAARVAMGILVASGRTRLEGTVDDDELGEVMSAVANRQLMAALAARSRTSLVRTTGKASVAVGLGLDRARARIRPARHPEAEPERPARRSATGGQVTEDTLPKGSIVVHIGPPKTGTTSIQAAFHACREAVEAQGVHYAGRRRHSISAVQAALGRRWIRSEEVAPIGHWHRLRDEILRSDADRVVLSSEFFADATPERIRAVMDELGRDRVQVVVTLRPLARIMPSQWQQYVQSGLRASYGPWLDTMLNKPVGKLSPSFWVRHRDHELVARWAAVVGPERVTGIVLDEADHAMVLRSFERLTGLTPGTLEPQDDHVNRSLTLEEVEAVRALNVAFHRAGLGRALHAEIVNFGATEFLKTAPPEPGTTRVALPEWAAGRVGEVSEEIVAGIAATGVRVIGDLDALGVVRTGPGPGPEGEEVRVPAATAGRLALGVLYATGLTKVPVVGAEAPASGAKRAKGRIPAAPESGPLRLGPKFTEPIEIARIPTRQLVEVMVGRGRTSLVRRVRRKPG